MSAQDGRAPYGVRACACACVRACVCVCACVCVRHVRPRLEVRVGVKDRLVARGAEREDGVGRAHLRRDVQVALVPQHLDARRRRCAGLKRGKRRQPSWRRRVCARVRVRARACARMRMCARVNA
eukprot:5739629-Pleurochrysis_carterae.AAC.5